MLSVLYLNHTSRVSGAEQSLLTLLAAVRSRASPVVACPEGPLMEASRALGVPVRRVPGTDGSLKLHPWHTTRGILDMGLAARAVRRIAAEEGANIVHANSIRAGLIATTGVPRRLPVVVHVRDCLPPGRLSTLSLSAVSRGAALVLANSEYTARSFTGSAGGPVRVAHSPVDLERFDTAGLARSEARARLGLTPSDFVLAVVAQLSPWKGQDDAICVVERLRDDFPDVRLLIVGSAKFVSKATRHDNRAYAGRLEALVRTLGLEREVAFLGEREDVPEILRAVDLLLAPSWEEPFGRSIAEAMACGVPAIATNVGGPGEIIGHEEDGLLLPPRDPARWAAAVRGLIEHPELLSEMGRKARERVRDRFGAGMHADQVLAAYDEALARAGPDQAEA